MIRGGKYKLKKLDMFGQHNVVRVCLGHIEIWPNKEKLSDYVVLESKWQAGDVVLYSKKTGNKFAVKADNLDKFHPKLYSPIGVVVIPQSHDVYGDGSAGVMSLKWMDCDNPDVGSIYPKTVWFGYGEPNLTSNFNSISSQSNNRCYYGNYGACTSDVKNTIQSYYTYQDTYFPSNKFENQEYVNDARLKYSITKSSSNSGKYWGISPYTDKDKKNIDFNEYAGAYFNGDDYQNIWLSLIDGSITWKTDKTILNSKDKEYHYPPFMCAWRYNTDGTEQGDWFIPSSSELLYILPKYNEIENALKKINTYFEGAALNTLNDGIGSSNYSFYSSNGYCNPVIYFNSGLYVGNKPTTVTRNFLAFTKMKSDIDNRVFYNIEFKLADGIDRVNITIDGALYTITSDNVFDNILKGTSISWEAIFDEDDFECENSIGEITSLEQDETIEFKTVKKPYEFRPTREIHYKTSNNEPCDWLGDEIKRNYYNEELGYNILLAKNDQDQTNLLFYCNSDSLTDLLYTPATPSSANSNAMLRGCANIKNVNIPTLPNLTSIGIILEATNTIKMNDFIINDMPNVTSLGSIFTLNRGGNYISTSISIERFVIGDMPNLKSIGGLLYASHEGNTNDVTYTIETLDLSGIKSVETIGTNFLYDKNAGNCTVNKTITNIILPPMPNLTKIESNVMRHLSTLKTLNLSASTKLTSIGQYFLSDCMNLTKCILPKSVTSISPYCFNGSTSLTHLETPILTTSIVPTVRSNLRTLVLNGDSMIDNLDAVMTSPNANLKIYVNDDLVDVYKNNYPTFESKIYSINDLP